MQALIELLVSPMTSPHSVLAAGLVWLSAAVVVPWLAAGESEIGEGSECQRSCGGVEIPFPFGIGPDHCMLAPNFRINCEDVGNGVDKAPFIPHTDVELLNISLEQGEVKVLNHISYYCSGRIKEWDQWHWNLSNTPYSFSNTANKFTVVGCQAVAYIIGDISSDTSAYMTGCVVMCFHGEMAVNPCSGMGCCQTDIPKGMQYYQVLFDRRLNTSEIISGDPCSFAVLMDSSNFTSSTSSSNNISSPQFINSPSAFNSSRGGKAPVVLDWSIGEDGCTTAVKNPAEYACRSINSNCTDAASGRGYICKCNQGFHGNPYRPDGCEEIDECDDPKKYPCYGVCTNTNGSFTCDCPTGTQGNASIAECHKDSFPLGARVATGIVAVILVALIALLSIQVFRNKENKKIRRYFEQHGGQMLSRILETDGNSTFKLYERGDLVKATCRFHEGNVVGQGQHGTVYKATLGTATVAVKRRKQIDKTRKDEFVQELVVLCRVSHPNIVRLLGCCLHFEAPMLVYEFVPNGTLSDLLHGTPRRRVTLPTRLRIATETAVALAHLHSPPHPTLHGDVKPQNILLGEGWEANVSDFGCSTINDNVQVVPKGTMAYLDPEFLQDNQITEKTDVYSFGVVLIELLTGKNPQARGNLIRMFQNCMENGTLGDLLDADIVEEGSVGLIYAAAKLVSQCIVLPGKARPAMAQVAEELRRFSNEMPESHEARVALEFEDHRYSYTTTEGETSGFSTF